MGGAKVSWRVLRVQGAIDHHIRDIKGFQRYFRGFGSSLEGSRDLQGCSSGRSRVQRGFWGSECP